MTTTAERVREVLHAAVAGVGGSERPGQVQMAEAVHTALTDGEHLLVQAGTGTGKSLAYLVPSLLHDSRVVVATATLALQHQLLERDVPALLEGAAEVLDRTPTAAVVKGRGNYACLHRVREGVPEEQGTLMEVPTGSLGAEVLALREWAEEASEAGEVGDRDSAPTHTERAWRQVSVHARECLGATRCPFADECFAELAKQRALDADLVVTNHALLAIDAIDGVPMLPDHDAVVVDEAHELAARVTQAATRELSPAGIERAARRARSLVKGSEADDLEDASDALRDAIAAAEPGRLEPVPDDLADALRLVVAAARACISALPREASTPGGEEDASRQQARAMLDEVRSVAEQMVAGSDALVVWVHGREPSAGGDDLRVAPIDVAGSLREHLFSEKTVVLTSATLQLGGGFGPVATSLGLRPDDEEVPWTSLDVGSPFDYARQGILYVARHLPPPGRDGPSEEVLNEVAALVRAAGGRTLGLFSSRRAAEAVAKQVRLRLPDLPVLCQGDAQLPELARRFTDDPRTSLFGTLSLWQGVDLPGPTCQLVIVDRVPFPRPDDPVTSSRQRRVERHGGNGFMQVAATHAALLLAQGTGRLIRRDTDRGVVAVLDPRLVTARYGTFLASSLPPMWRTTDRQTALAALRRLDEAAGD